MTRGRGRPREFDRAQGLEKALRVFWSLGYEATSMADLRAALGINQGSLYAAYGSKETLFLEVVALYKRTDGVATSRALSSGLSTREAIHAMLQDGVDMFTADRTSRGCLLVLSAIHCNIENKGVQEYLSSLRAQTLREVKDRLRHGQRDGDLPSSTSIAGMAAFYVTVLYGLSIQAKDGATRKVLTQVVTSAMSAWELLAGDTGKNNHSNV